MAKVNDKWNVMCTLYNNPFTLEHMAVIHLGHGIDVQPVINKMTPLTQQILYAIAQDIAFGHVQWLQDGCKVDDSGFLRHGHEGQKHSQMRPTVRSSALLRHIYMLIYRA